MCRSIENHYGRYQKERERLKIRAFYVRLSIANALNPLPETLTLLYLPRINGSLLEINGAKIQSNSAAFVVLHRVHSAEGEEAVFRSTDRVRGSEGVRFEVYVKEEKVLKGIFRKDEEEGWKMECRCAVESDLMVGFGVLESEVYVAGEGCGVMKERVEMVVRRKRRKFLELEEIPEEREIVLDGCDCGEWEVGSDGEDSDEEEVVEIEGMRWAVDLGIWVMCLGVGILVSRASSRSLMRKRRLI
ncbi:NADP-specific glutamate dehydrogenase [Tasmannia lanceolata]|uniref:NADP-specific glutamate dehydrogenase n=1 Tax=Tasmannia lanceolata TaxID=3420 RepID=UPI004064AB58